MPVTRIPRPFSNNSIFHSHPVGSITGLGAIVDGINDSIEAVDAKADALDTSLDALDVRVEALEDAPGSSDPWTYVKLSQEQSVSVTSNTAVTGLNFTPAANTSYGIEVWLLLRTSTATTGPRPGIAWPGGMTDGASQMTSPNSNTALAFRNQGAISTQNAASTGLPTTTDSYLALGNALLIMGASPTGTFGITLASETNAVAVSIRAGSFIRYRTI